MTTQIVPDACPECAGRVEIQSEPVDFCCACGDSFEGGKPSCDCGVCDEHEWHAWEGDKARCLDCGEALTVHSDGEAAWLVADSEEED